MHLQADLGRLAGKQRNGVANVRGRVAGRLVEHRHVKAPAHAAVDVVDAAAKRIHGRQQPQGFVVNALAFGREGKTRPPAPAQREAQAGFQVFHVAADGAGADVQLQLGGRHAAALHHGLEHLQQAQVHVAELAQHGAVFGGRRDRDARRRWFHLHKTSSKH
jgi:hypothetical protein